MPPSYVGRRVQSLKAFPKACNGTQWFTYVGLTPKERQVMIRG